MAPEDKSYASPAGDMAKLLAAIEKLQSEVADIKKKVDGKKEPKKEYDSELALAAALAPLCGLSAFGFGSSLLLPFGLRLAAARALVLHRALDRAATITKELAKAGDESPPTSVFLAVAGGKDGHVRGVEKRLDKQMTSRGSRSINRVQPTCRIKYA